eukprot:929256-Lingulodinium_polyedra.AAC.1
MSTLRRKTPRAQPGRMPQAGAHSAPSAPSARSRRGALDVAVAGPVSHPGTPALARVRGIVAGA